MPTPTVGSEFAGYHVLSVLGRGGMSVVYLAEQDYPKRKVALKVLSPDLAEDERFRERFIRESNLAASLDHPNIIPIFGAGEAEGVLYIAMRYVRSTDLAALIKREGPLDPDRALRIVGQAAAALDTAHAEGLVHRDVKPANILIAEGSGSGGTDHVYLSDFGLTKRAQSKSGLTGTGQFMGTIDYVAPEQISGTDVDGRADEYALGCVLFETLTGSVPFDKDEQVAVIAAHLMTPPPLVTDLRADLPAGLAEVVARAMAKDRADRYPTCGAFVDAARAAVRGEAAAPGVTRPGVEATALIPPPAVPVAAPTTPAAPVRPAPPPVPATAAVRQAQAAAPTPPSAPSGPTPAAPRPRRRPMVLVAAGLAIVVIAVVAVVALGHKRTPAGQGPLRTVTPSSTSSVGSTSPGGTGGVIFQDSFDNPASGWPDSKNSGGTFGYANGAYSISVAHTGISVMNSDANLQSLTDMIIQADVTKTAGPDANDRFGIACRDTQLGFYIFVITSTGRFRIDRVFNGNSVTLTGGSSPGIHTGNATNHIRGDCTGGVTGGPVSLAMFVNGSKVADIKDSDPSSIPLGGPGLGAAGQAGLVVTFDNLTVTQPAT